MHFTYGQHTVDELDSSRKNEFSRMTLLLYKCKKNMTNTNINVWSNN